MNVKNYWVGDKPAGTWTIQVLNQRTGDPEDLSNFTEAKVLIVDSDNNVLTFGLHYVVITGAPTGLVTFLWPSESVFTKPGRYAVQLELRGVNAVRHTTVQEILVREIGGVTK